MSNKWVTGLQNKASQLVTEKLNLHKWNSKYFKYYEIIWTYSLEGLFKVNMCDCEKTTFIILILKIVKTITNKNRTEIKWQNNVIFF